MLPWCCIWGFHCSFGHHLAGGPALPDYLRSLQYFLVVCTSPCRVCETTAPAASDKWWATGWIGVRQTVQGISIQLQLSHVHTPTHKLVWRLTPQGRAASASSSLSSATWGSLLPAGPPRTLASRTPLRHYLHGMYSRELIFFTDQIKRWSQWANIIANGSNITMAASSFWDEGWQVRT